MKKKIFLILFFIPILVYSQGNVKNKIQWLNLNEAQEYSKKYKKNMFVYFYRPIKQQMNRHEHKTITPFIERAALNIE